MIFLSALFSGHDLRSITVARLEVPCFGGVKFVSDRALARSGNKVPVREITISIGGQVL